MSNFRSLFSFLALLITMVIAGETFATPADGYDLRSNWTLAHIWKDGVVADASQVGFIKYTRDRGQRWKYNQKQDGRVSAFCPGLQANVWLPVNSELAGKDLVVEAMVYPFGSKVDVFLTGEDGKDKKIGSPKLEQGWQIIRVNAGSLNEGIYKIRLHFDKAPEKAGQKTAAAVRYIRLANASSEKLPLSENELQAALPSIQGDSVNLPANTGLDWYVMPPKGMKLTAQAQGNVAFSTGLDGKALKALANGSQIDADLDQAGGLSSAKRSDLNQARALRVVARSTDGATFSGKIHGGTSTEPVIKKPKYIVFWMIDTLRADKLKFSAIPNANGRKVETPSLDALAKDSFVADPYYIQGTESKASHASIWTGTYPTVHKFIADDLKLPSSFETMPELLKKAGYVTRGFSSNGYVSDRWNFQEGFDQLNNFVREEKAHNAKAVFDSAAKWIPEHKDKPFYLYLGTTDPHVTYRQHEDLIQKYDGKSYNGSYKKYISGEELGRLKGKSTPPSERERKRIEALYENEIDFNAIYFGKLVDLLKEQGIWDETLLIVTGDHGDEFWEHGSCGHGHNVHQELVRVPMLLRFPGVFPVKQSTAGFEGVDLLPTLAHLVGAKVPKEVQGRDMLPYMYSDGVYPSAVISAQGVGQHGLQLGNAKAIYSSEASIKIYNTEKDPFEKDDIYGKEMILTLSALDPLILFLSRSTDWHKAMDGAPNNLMRDIK